MYVLRSLLADRLELAPGPSPLSAHDYAAPPPLVLPDEEMQAAAELAAQWNSSVRPWDAFESWLLEQVAALAMVRDRCRHHAAALRAADAHRAALCWDEDRRAEAETLAAALRRRPAEVAARLRQSRPGAELLIGRWEALARALEANGTWSVPQRRLALDLLGVPPELRDDGATPLDPAPGVEPPDHLRALAAGELERLRALAAGPLADLDTRDRADAARGLPPEGQASPALAALRRHERSTSLQLEWCLSRFRKARPSPSSSPSPRPDGTEPRGYAPDAPRPSTESAPAPLPSRAASAHRPEPAPARKAARTRVDAFPCSLAPRDDSPSEVARAPAFAHPDDPLPNRKARRATASRASRRG